MTDTAVDLVVLGGGSAGYACAMRAAELGSSVVLIERDKAAYGEQPSVRVPYDAISEARLILTDDLIRDALSKDNRARKEARKRRGEPEEGAADEQAADETEQDN